MIRPFIAALLGATACALAGNAAAQSYPAKPVRLVVGFAPAGAADYVARAMSESFGRALGQPVLVENRPGAGSSVAAEYVAHAAPDGYTLLLASPSSISVNPALNPKLNYSPKDLVPITKVSSSFLVAAVNPNLGINNLRDLIAAAKKEPGKLNYATSGNGSAPHLSSVYFASIAGLDIVHVPFKGGGPAVQSVIAGDTQFTFGTSPSVLPLIRAGRLKALAITTKNRSPLAPDLPGMAEAGLPAYDMSFWYGLFAPAGTPAAVLKKVFDSNAAALRDDAVRQAFAREGTETAASKSQEEFSAFLAEDSKFWVKLVKDSGAKID